MTYLAIAYIDGRYQVYRTEDAIARTNVGPRWRTPREASTYIEALGARAAGEEPVHLGGDIPHRQLGADRLPPRVPGLSTAEGAPVAVPGSFFLSLWDGD